jgi:hypothetical protein
MVDVCPFNMLLGLSVSDTLGGLGITCTVAESSMVPVWLVHEMAKTYSLMVDKFVMVWLPPLTAFAPLQSPLAVQLVGEFSVVQLSVMLAPGCTGPVGLLLRNTMGLPGGTD